MDWEIFLTHIRENLQRDDSLMKEIVGRSLC